MTTDPLCPQQHTHPKHNPKLCIFCKEFAAVREDERGKRFTDTRRDVYDRGYEQGQSDERDRIRDGVKALADGPGCSCSRCGTIREALNVIDPEESSYVEV